MLERIFKAQALMDTACDALGRDIYIMEVCGTHTVSIFRNGIRTTLPGSLKLLSGPGCPVCVTDQGYIDITLALADRDDCIVATYGDMIRVPGKNGSLEKKHRSNVKVVLSSEDALDLAKQNPDKTVVFIAVGFETTAPATAVAVGQAHSEGIDNFCIFSGHKLVIPAMEALLTEKNNKIDAFLCPGHGRDALCGERSASSLHGYNSVQRGSERGQGHTRKRLGRLSQRLHRNPHSSGTEGAQSF